MRGIPVGHHRRAGRRGSFPFAAMFRSHMTCACVLIALCPLMAGCETRAAPTPPKALVASATPYVEIIDVATPDHRENRILRVEPADDDALFLQELYDFAIRYFPDGW